MATRLEGERREGEQEDEEALQQSLTQIAGTFVG
jgi:hypothetical protein